MKKKVVLICLIFTISFIICIISIRKIFIFEMPLYTEITVNSIEKKIDKKESFALYIYQQACAACSNTKPIVNKYIRNNNEKIYAVDLNNDENKRFFAQKLDISATPTIIFFYKGIEKERVIGIFDYDLLHKKMKEIKGEEG